MKINCKLKYSKILGLFAVGIAIGYTICDIYELASIDNRNIYVMFTFTRESADALEYSKIGIWEDSKSFLERIADIKPYLNPVAYQWLEETLKKNTPDIRYVAITGVNIGDRTIPTLFGENCLL